MWNKADNEVLLNALKNVVNTSGNANEDVIEIDLIEWMKAKEAIKQVENK